MPPSPAPTRSFAQDLQAGREAVFHEQVNELMRVISDPTLLPPPEGRYRGGFDGSSLSCDCVCHNLIGPGRGSRRKRKRPQPSSCDHCRVYG